MIYKQDLKEYLLFYLFYLEINYLRITILLMKKLTLSNTSYYSRDKLIQTYLSNNKLNNTII